MKRSRVWVFLCCKSALLLALLLCISAQKLNAASYTITDMVGRIRITDASGQSSVPQTNDKIEDHALVRTFRDSSISFQGEGFYYRIHAASQVRFRDEPVLVYGKLSKSIEKDFIDLHFYYLPTPAQGRTMKVVIHSTDRDIKVRSSLITDDCKARELRVYHLGEGKYRALTGFDCEAPAVRYNLHIDAYSEGIGYTQIIYPFFLQQTRFPNGRVVLAPAQDKLMQPSETKRKQSAHLLKILSVSSEQSLWDGAFIHPLEEAEIISAFGKKRTYYISGKPVRVGHHRGIDYRAPRGTPVFAPANGIVALSAERVTTGNTLVIDHGHGVFSLFFHLDSISVEEGARVTVGDKVAEAGSTGIAVGPHLHWGLWIDGTYVNPLDWLERYF